MKKKLLVLLLIVVCLASVFALASCGGGGNEDDGRPSYTVTFDPAGGTFDGELTIQVKEGDKIPEPAKPVFEGRIFSGWYSGKAASSRWSFEEDVVTSDITLKAWYAGGVGCAHEVTVPVPEKSTAATCEKGGKEYVKCTKCGLTTFTNIPKLGHDLVTDVIEVTCATDGYTHVYCTRSGCDEDRTHSIIPATGDHIYGEEYETLVEATMYVGGKEARICQVCGAQMIFDIKAYAELDGLLEDLEIGNYKYTGGKYNEEPFVNIAKYAGISATSYYTICYAKNATDGSTSSFWCADTLAEGANFTGDTITLDFDSEFDVGMISIVLPFYSSWGLGEDCYVSYDLEAKINGEWQKVGELNDKNAISAGVSGKIVCEFDAPVTTSSLRLVVTNSSRYTPAMIYEIEVMAAVDKDNRERVSVDLVNSATISSSGKYNSWATGTETLMDGLHSTGWYTNKTGDIYAALSFANETFVTAVQFSVAPNTNKEYTIYYLDENDEWVSACHYKLQVGGGKVTTEGDSNNDGLSDGALVEIDGAARVIITCDIVKFTKGVKLTIDVPGPNWESYVYEFIPYTAVEQAAGIDYYSGCSHNSFKELTPVQATCSSAGYTPMQCRVCGFESSSRATDALGHIWSDYKTETPATGINAGTKTSTCSTCDAKRTTHYYNDYDDAAITTYLHNAPAAWAQSLDDGNYIETYEWIIPKLQERGWKATAMLSVCYSETYVSEWKNYFATGALDLGSHSYTHGGYYSGIISESSLLSDVVNAHYWFMNNFAGQKILTFATPNGQTSEGTSEYVTGIMASARNGGLSKYFYNLITDFELVGDKIPVYDIDEEGNKVQKTDANGNLVWTSERRVFGNMNSYISKSDQTEGPFVFVDSNNTTPISYKKITQAPVIDETTGEQAVDENGNLLWETLEAPIYESVKKGGYVLNDKGSYEWADSAETHHLVKSPSGGYFYVAKEELANNYLYDAETNRLALKERGEGTYRFVKEENDSYYEWVEVGSYDYSNNEFVFRNDNDGAYKLNHTGLGSYEKGINEILEAGGMTVECIHCIMPDGTVTNQIWSSYTSTNSKFNYLDQTGIWVCSYTELIQYVREQLYATVTTLERTESSVTLSLTDTLDDLMFDAPLTIKVDVDDSWTAENITATQDGSAVEFFVEDGYVYVDAVPDQGNVVISYNG